MLVCNADVRKAIARGKVHLDWVKSVLTVPSDGVRWFGSGNAKKIEQQAVR